MTSKIAKLLVSVIVILCLSSISGVYFFYFPTQAIEVDFLDVGQGDSILIKSPFGQNILIDGGPDKSVIRRLSENLPWWDRQIDLMILTHPHDDHLTGLQEVLNRYQVNKVLYTGVNEKNSNYTSWLQNVQNKNIPVILAGELKNISFGPECNLKFIYPNKSLAGLTVGNLNNSSLVIRLTYKNKTWLLMGDSEGAVEAELIKRPKDLLADIIKIGHHGSDNSSSENFLKLVKPEYAVIQVGEKNDFNHPSKRILKRLERDDIKILRTGLNGTVRITSDGEKLKIK